MDMAFIELIGYKTKRPLIIAVDQIESISEKCDDGRWSRKIVTKSKNEWFASNSIEEIKEKILAAGAGGL